MSSRKWGHPIFAALDFLSVHQACVLLSNLFPGGRYLQTFVTKHAERAIPASPSIASRHQPDLPTNGLPMRSSSAPGASPTSIKMAGIGPNAGTLISNAKLRL